MSPERVAQRSPIYLVPASPRRVTTDEHSLLVAGEGRPLQRYPLRLLNRIVCNERVDWSGQALTRCLGRGILIQWLRATQCTVGTAWPLVTEPDELGALIEAALECRGWEDRHDNWLRHQRMRIVKGAIHGENLAPTLVGDAVYHDRLPDTLHPYARMVCGSAVMAAVHQFGLRPHYPAPEGGGLNLAQDLTRLVELELALVAKLPINDGPANLLAAERWLGLDHARIPKLVGRLRRAAGLWTEA